MTSVAQDTDQINRVVALYIEGSRYGDADRLRDAFHPEARMWGSLGGQRVDIPITEMIAMVDGKPVDVDGSYQARIVSVDQTDDAASVVLEEDGFWGNVSFVDFFSLARIDGMWKIVNKTFVHTGGTPPARA
jgi:hypothetical protein